MRKVLIACLIVAAVVFAGSAMAQTISMDSGKAAFSACCKTAKKCCKQDTCTPKCKPACEPKCKPKCDPCKPKCCKPVCKPKCDPCKPKCDPCKPKCKPCCKQVTCTPKPCEDPCKKPCCPQAIEEYPNACTCAVVIGEFFRNACGRKDA